MRRRGSRAERKVRARLTQNNWLEDGLIRPLNQLPSLSLSLFSPAFFSLALSLFFLSLCLLFHPLGSSLTLEKNLSYALALSWTVDTACGPPLPGPLLPRLRSPSRSGSILAQRLVLYRNCLWPVLIRCYWIRWGEESISALWITGHLYLCV